MLVGRQMKQEAVFDRGKRILNMARAAAPVAYNRPKTAGIHPRRTVFYHALQRRGRKAFITFVEKLLL